MRARIIALCILLLLIGGPFILYWFFMQKHTSSLEISFGSGIEATISLQGEFSSGWFPLANKALSFSQTCQQTCVFLTIPPALYTVSLLSNGRAPIKTSVQVGVGQAVKKVYAFQKNIELISEDIFKERLSNEGNLSEEAIQKELGTNIALLGSDFTGKIWLAKKEGIGTQIGIYKNKQFLFVKNIPTPLQNIRLDPYGRVFILSFSNSGVLFLTLDLTKTFETSFSEEILGASYGENTWHITTASGGYDYNNNTKNWEENMRFTDWLDVDRYTRIGYIASEDIKKLELSNYTSKEGSVLLLINRKTGEVTSAFRGKNVERLFSFKDQAYILSQDMSTQRIAF